MSLGDERLSTTDNKGNRIFLYPAEVRGFFRRHRNIVEVALILFFLILPWLKWNGIQIFLFDIPNRTFHLFGILFKAHDAPLIFLVLAVGTISLAFVTALFGRVWCGWACPQTVFIDGIYRRIEAWIQGNYIKRRKLSGEPWHKEKILKVSLTWLCYFVVSAVIAHSFVAYFVGSDRLIGMMTGTPKENWTAFTIVMGMTLVLLFNFGWFREQFCIIACPYGRIQAVLMDKKSLSVMYDYNRGEPRKDPNISKEKQGDCVNCNRCVEVCPTGIDIRRGIQMECIGCTACIDACDEIMEKVKKPLGLIRYSSEFEIESKTHISVRNKILRPRVLAYLFVILLMSTLLIYFVQSRDPLMVSVLKAKEAPYSLIKENGEDRVLNHFKLHMHNQSSDIIFAQISSDIELVLPQNNLMLNPNTSREIHFFAKFSTALIRESGGSIKKDLRIDIRINNKNTQILKELTLVGPY
ncbi:MAG: cytochrome c oxidase accessory protein CcoG [Bdellovibrionota bacterium]